ncbi:MAG: NAD(P)-binding domain-containing protein [Deltaproteobacteria bacterium]|nr:NAD(P)-binding domain-containing protein [Deltaproteobacteria bacterium]
MKIGILGTGDVGRTLGGGFLALGHEVMMGSRSAANEKAAAWAREAGGKASSPSFADAAAFGEVVVLATLGSATEGILGTAGATAFEGKTVIDATNPLDFSTGAPTLYVGTIDSLGERIQKALPGAHVVKAFNTVGHAHMFRPSFHEGRPDMFIAGDHDGAKRQVSGILETFGWGVADLGGIEGSRWLEAMCMAWVAYAFKHGTWDHAFKLLRK